MTTNQSGSNPGGLQLKVQNALVGVQQTLPTGKSFDISGQAVTQAQLVTKLSGYLPVLKAVTDAKAALAQAVSARQAVEPEIREFLVQLRAALVASYGRQPVLTQFGMSAKKPTAPSPQTAVLAAAKRTLTRQKRGTMGKSQKASIKAVGTPQVSLGPSGVQIAPAAPEAQPAAAPVAPSPAPVTPEPVGPPPAK